MPPIEDLPYELISEILSLAVTSNLNSPDAITYTYGLTQAGRPLRNSVKTERYLRGRTPPDVLCWNSVSAIRHVNARWHNWALSFALHTLYIRRWRGGETWVRSSLTDSSSADSNPNVVYQDPYTFVRATAKLFTDFPHLAHHIRRLWFNGIYRPDTINHIFHILTNCVNVHAVSLPWTSLRYGAEADWTNLTSFPRLRALEFLAVDLKSQVCALPSANTDHAVLRTPGLLDFSRLRRLKLGGETNLLPLTDDDLTVLAQTTTGLHELLIANAPSTVTIAGVTALVTASRDSIRLLDYTASHPGTAPQDGICELIASCPHIQDLAITLPRACPKLFANPHVAWHETVRLRVADPGPTDTFVTLLDAARTLLATRAADAPPLEIEITGGKDWLFDTRQRRVHGAFRLPADGEWRPATAPSVKGPYGYTGHHSEQAGKGEWMVMSENEFWDGVKAGLLSFA